MSATMPISTYTDKDTKKASEKETVLSFKDLFKDEDEMNAAFKKKPMMGYFITPDNLLDLDLLQKLLMTHNYKLAYLLFKTAGKPGGFTMHAKVSGHHRGFTIHPMTHYFRELALKGKDYCGTDNTKKREAIREFIKEAIEAGFSFAAEVTMGENPYGPPVTIFVEYLKNRPGLENYLKRADEISDTKVCNEIDQIIFEMIYLNSKKIESAALAVVKQQLNTKDDKQIKLGDTESFFATKDISGEVLRKILWLHDDILPSPIASFLGKDYLNCGEELEKNILTLARLCYIERQKLEAKLRSEKAELEQKTEKEHLVTEACSIAPAPVIISVNKTVPSQGTKDPEAFADRNQSDVKLSLESRVAEQAQQLEKMNARINVLEEQLKQLLALQTQKESGTSKPIVTAFTTDLSGSDRSEDRVSRSEISAPGNTQKAIL